VSGDPTLLICVGATKAGTTWLYDHLARHDGCHLRSIKELHYFGCVETGRWDHQIRVHEQAEARLRRRLARAAPARRGLVARKLADVTDWLAVLRRRALDAGAYLAYLAAGRGGRALVADITPAYALLPEARLRQMAGIAPDVRVLYLLRDPVARLWSQLRMDAARAGGGQDGAAAAEALMARVLDGADHPGMARSDYAGTIARLTAAVAPDRLMLAFYETLTTLPGLDRISRFLGIDRGTPDFARRLHEGPAHPLPPALAQRARAVLRPQYDFVARLMPDLPAAWRANMDEVTP